MLTSQACPPLGGHSLILTRGWFPGTYFHCPYQIKFVTIDGDDDDDIDDDGDEDGGDDGGGKTGVMMMMAMVVLMVMVVMVVMT